MTKKRITDIYLFLATAHIGKMEDEEKAAMIRLLRKMKPIAQEIQQAIIDATAIAKTETNDQQEAARLVNLAVADILEESTDIEIAVLSAEGFQRMVSSNDWTLGQIEELESEMVK